MRNYMRDVCECHYFIMMKIVLAAAQPSHSNTLENVT